MRGAKGGVSARRGEAPLVYRHKHTFVDLAHFGGQARHILPTLSPSQPVIADEEIICWGTLPKFKAFFAFCDQGPPSRL